MDMEKTKFTLGIISLAASLLVLVYQQPIGEVIGTGVMVLWMVLGALGVYLMGFGKE
jgi:hypothetical protein